MLQWVLKGRIVFTPTADGGGYTFEAPTRFDKLSSGVMAPPAWMDPNNRTGKEHLTPEDTFDADYGRLLEQATVIGMARPAGFEPATSWFVAVRRRSASLRTE